MLIFIEWRPALELWRRLDHEVVAATVEAHDPTIEEAVVPEDAEGQVPLLSEEPSLRQPVHLLDVGDRHVHHFSDGESGGAGYPELMVLPLAPPPEIDAERLAGATGEETGRRTGVGQRPQCPLAVAEVEADIKRRPKYQPAVGPVDDSVLFPIREDVEQRLT